MRLSLVAAIVICGTAAAQQAPPLGFKDLILGMPLAESGLSTRLNCKHENPPRCVYLGKYAGGPAETIAGEPINAILLSRRDGAIDSIMVTFKAKAFEQVRDGLAEKYPGLKCAHAQVQNRMGATFDQVVCSYETADGNHVELDKRGGGTVDESYMYFTTAENRTAAAKQRASGRKDI